MNKKSFKNIFKASLKSIGVIVFIVLIYKIGFNRLIGAFNNIKLLPLIITVVLLVSANISKALRWRIICRGYDYEIDILFTVKTYLIGTFLGFLTPGRIGDLSRSYYLLEKKIPLKKGLITVIIDRFYDLFFLFLFVIISIIYLQNRFKILTIDKSKFPLFLAYVCFIVVLFIITFFILKSNYFRRFRDKIKEIYFDYIRIGFKSKEKISIAALTVCALLIGYGLFYYLSYSLNIPIGFVDIIACAFVISFLQLLPITILGIGTRDLTLLYFFKLNPYLFITTTMGVRHKAANINHIIFSEVGIISTPPVY